MQKNIIIPPADKRQHDTCHFDKQELIANLDHAHPLDLFATWYQKAQETEISDPNAMSLGTIDAYNFPNIRIVLMKNFDQTGISFYTNYTSKKGQELNANPHASLCFHWKSQLQQIRLKGIVRQLPEAQSDAYFATRDRNSKIGAWVSDQSAPISGRTELLKALNTTQKKFEHTKHIPRPPHWGGYHFAPLEIEYWQNGAFRLHDRLVYYRETLNDPWQSYKLYP